MKIKDLPPFYNIDKVRIYFGNEVKTEFWCESPRAHFWEIPLEWKAKEIDSLNIVLTGISVEIVVLEIILKNF